MVTVAAVLLLQGASAVSQSKPYPKPQVASAVLQEAPDFAFKDQDGKDFKLSDQRGRWVLLYFYRGYW